jgi:small subunit ribosomal protein S18
VGAFSLTRKVNLGTPIELVPFTIGRIVMADMENDDRNGRGNRNGRSSRHSRRRRVSRLTAERIDYIDFKDVKLLQSFIAENGKILPRRLTGVSAWQQRKVTEAIKRARNIALLPYTKY